MLTISSGYTLENFFGGYMKKLGLISTLFLAPSWLVCGGIENKMLAVSQMEQGLARARARERFDFLLNCFPVELQAVLQQATLSKAEKQAIFQLITAHQLMHPSDFCESLQKKTKEDQDELPSQEVADIEALGASGVAHLKYVTAQCPPHIKQLIAKHYYQALKYADVNSLTLMNISFNDVASAHSISYQRLTELVSEYIARAILRLNQELVSHTRVAMSIFNMPHAQMVLYGLVEFATGMTIQRWFEHDFTEQRWRQLLGTQYAAFDRMVPHICAVVAALNEQEANAQ
jgi:hypothetical protein